MPYPFRLLIRWQHRAALMTYHIKQQREKKFPTSEIHKKEALVFNNFGFEYFNRINFIQHGNRIGTFLDVGLYLNWAYRTKYFVKDKNNRENSFSKIEEHTYKDLSYTKPINYGLKFRLGFNRYVFTGSYRLSDLFNEEVDMELPLYSVGIQLGIHK